MPKKLDNLDKQVMRNFGQFMRSYGMKDSHAKIISLLYVEPEEVTMEELSNKTGYSLATISNTMQILLRNGMVEKRKRPGSKKNYYYMEKNIIKLNQKKIKSFQENYLRATKEKLPELIEKYEERVETEKQERKLQIIRNYYQQLIQMEEILEEIKERLQEIENA